MNQQDDTTRQSQSQSQQQQSQRRTGGPFVDDTERAGGGLHPGSDRDDYGSPHGIEGTVGTQYEQAGDAASEHERERLEPGQVGAGEQPGDSGAPAGYGDRGQHEQGRSAGRGWPGREEQQGRIDPGSEHARQAEQGESDSQAGAGHPRGDWDVD
ncbi:hypothetical protein N0B51_13570 [Tsuneonella sp. YG55]|uniref:Uncharacterized protein n=1 Tax=Tsuneonella litorea TaxID=2976475 RepID=A0A9X2W2Q1_9SPHN|nr:hypothetical protein [Tsuneonella litorea]MCT2560007.1 hypothetical protein [Tsuneonella litorea]